jgi:hypothetical protein
MQASITVVRNGLDCTVNLSGEYFQEERFNGHTGFGGAQAIVRKATIKDRPITLSGPELQAAKRALKWAAEDEREP